MEAVLDLSWISFFFFSLLCSFDFFFVWKQISFCGLAGQETRKKNKKYFLSLVECPVSNHPTTHLSLPSQQRRNVCFSEPLPFVTKVAFAPSQELSTPKTTESKTFSSLGVTGPKAAFLGFPNRQPMSSCFHKNRNSKPMSTQTQQNPWLRWQDRFACFTAPPKCHFTLHIQLTTTVFWRRQTTPTLDTQKINPWTQRNKNTHTWKGYKLARTPLGARWNNPLGRNLSQHPRGTVILWLGLSSSSGWRKTHLQTQALQLESDIWNRCLRQQQQQNHPLGHTSNTPMNTKRVNITTILFQRQLKGWTMKKHPVPMWNKVNKVRLSAVVLPFLSRIGSRILPHNPLNWLAHPNRKHRRFILTVRLHCLPNWHSWPFFSSLRCGWDFMSFFAWQSNVLHNENTDTTVWSTNSIETKMILFSCQ